MHSSVILKRTGSSVHLSEMQMFRLDSSFRFLFFPKNVCT